MAAEDYFEYEGEMCWFGVMVDEWDKRDAERNKARPTDFPDLDAEEDTEEDEP